MNSNVTPSTEMLVAALPAERRSAPKEANLSIALYLFDLFNKCASWDQKIDMLT